MIIGGRVAAIDPLLAYRWLFIVSLLLVSTAAGAAPLNAARQAALRSEPPKATLLIRAGTPSAVGSVGPSDLTTAVSALSEALTVRGFRAAPSFDEADAIVEVLGRRQLLQHLGPRGQIVTALDIVRARILIGDDVTEVRGHSSSSGQIVISAVADAAEEIEQWLQGRAVPHARNRQGGHPPATVPLDALLARAAAYVAAYERQFASVIGQERYRQQVAQERVLDEETSWTRVVKTSRSLRSELSFAWFPDVPGWFGFRDVIEVDGKAVKDRNRRLAQLFFEKPTGSLLARALQESARYNLGTIRRNFNVPLVALRFVAVAMAGRFQFEDSGEEFVGGVPVRVVRYQETARPTAIRANDDGDAPARGRFWIEPGTGRVVVTEVVIGDAFSDIRIVTWYRRDERLGMLVPWRMTETYDYTQRAYDVIECEATYSDFRRFETAGRMVVPK